MRIARIVVAAGVGAVLALGPASVAVADVGPIDWSGGNRDSSPPVTKKSHPSTPSKSHKPNTPAKPGRPTVQTNTPKQTPAKPQTPTAQATPDKRRQKPAFKVGAPDAIGEAAFYGVGKPRANVASGRVEAKGRPAVAPAEGKTEAQRPAPKAPESSVHVTRTPPRQTVVRVPEKPAAPTITPKGGQLPIGAPRTGFGSAAGSGLDPVILATGAVAALGGLTLAGVGVARRRRVCL